MSKPKSKLNDKMFVNGIATRECSAFYAMSSRSKRNNYAYKDVSVHEVFQGPNGFEAFLQDVGPCPNKDFDLDRIDNNKGYEPGNLRWVSRQDNLLNRRVTLKVELESGELEPLIKYCDRNNLNYLKLKQRYKGSKVINYRSLI